MASTTATIFQHSQLNIPSCCINDLCTRGCLSSYQVKKSITLAIDLTNPVTATKQTNQKEALCVFVRSLVYMAPIFFMLSEIYAIISFCASSLPTLLFSLALFNASTMLFSNFSFPIAFPSSVTVTTRCFGGMLPSRSTDTPVEASPPTTRRSFIESSIRSRAFMPSWYSSTVIPMALAICSIWARFSSSSSSSTSRAPPLNMFSPTTLHVCCGLAIADVLDVVKACVCERAAAQAAMIMAEVFMVAVVD
mmetsp:Transcript_22336/g.54103  ORF Transcript_22336/g.54103 Transcript_22336/m.54103 type:complete len:250 (+) Transcript_22336:199-948(+)